MPDTDKRAARHKTDCQTQTWAARHKHRLLDTDKHRLLDTDTDKHRLLDTDTDCQTLTNTGC